ncbi:MAG TPA: hypothetical protein VNA20_15010 [Frankiaceae bacterium]|nr:hypothetical protein [Frankiaceae bacterium]
MEKFDALTDEELATVVAAGDVHSDLRRRLGWCGCGAGPLHTH